MSKSRSRNGFTRKEVIEELKRTERFTDSEGEWLARRAAARYTGYHSSTLLGFKKNCPLLGGRKLRTRPFRGAFGREDDYFLKTHLDELNAARASLVTEPETPGHRSLESVVAEAGVSRATINNVRREGTPHVPSVKKIGPTKKVLALRKDGQPCRKVMIPAKPIERYLRSRGAEHVPHDRMTTREAAIYLQRNRSSVLKLVEKGVLQCIPDQWIACNGFVRRGRHLLRAEVEAYKIARDAKKAVQGRDELRDADGLWITLKAALDRYPNATLYCLYTHANRPCPQLDGEVLHAKKVPVGGPRNHRHKTTMFFLDADLRRLNPPRVGQPGQIRNKFRSGLTPIPSAASVAAERAPADVNAEKETLKEYDGSPTSDRITHERLQAIKDILEKRLPAGTAETVPPPVVYQEPKERKRPAAEKHATWERWQDEGLSHEKIRRRWERETGEVVTRDAVRRALKRRSRKD